MEEALDLSSDRILNDDDELNNFSVSVAPCNLRIARSKGSTGLVRLYLKTEVKPASETLCF